MFGKVSVTALATLLVVGTLSVAPASAAKISNGTACTKAGAKTTVSGYKYTCAKNALVKNSKLTWLSAECLTAVTNYQAAIKASTDLKDVTAQAADLDTQLITANTALTNTTTSLDTAKAQLVSIRAKLATTTNTADKQAISAAITKLANAVLILSASKSKLAMQVKDLESKRTLLASAPGQIQDNINSTKASAALLCTKGY